MSLSTLRPKKKPGQARQDEGQGHSCTCHCHSPLPTHPHPLPTHPHHPPHHHPPHPPHPPHHHPPHPHHFHPHPHPHSHPSSSALRGTSSSSSPGSSSSRKSSRYLSSHPLRRAVKSYYPATFSSFPRSELIRFHHQIQLRMMEKHPDRWYKEAFPEPMRPLIKEIIPQLAKHVFVDRGTFYTVMKKAIEEVKNGNTDVHLILFKPIPPTIISNDVVWDFNVGPHCRFMYLEVQKTLILHIAKETRFMETLPRDQLKFDDSDKGVQGHALARIRYGLKKQLFSMGIVEDEYSFLCSASRKSGGVTALPDDPAEFKSVHSCDRMFVPHRDDPKVDAAGAVWPTMVIETGPAHANVASRKYLQFCVDWWFTQSNNVTKTVILMYFDYGNRETIVEKWVKAAEPPFHKTLAQTIVINIQPSRDAKNPKDLVVVSGQALTLSLESLMGRPKREGETDIVFDKTFMTGFANGYLLPWPNVGPIRKEVVLGTDLPKEDAAAFINAVSSAAAAAAASIDGASAGARGANAAPPNIASLGPALSRVLNANVPRYVGKAGTPKVDYAGSSVKVTLKRTDKPFTNEDGTPVPPGEHEMDKPEHKKVTMEMSLEQIMALMGTQD